MNLAELAELLTLLKKHRVYAFSHDGLKLQFAPDAFVIQDELVPEADNPEANEKTPSDDDDLYYSSGA